MGGVGSLVDGALPAGSLSTIGQPRLVVDERVVLRPWHGDDAATVQAAFECPDIQRWHVQRMDDEDEARAWIAGWADRWAAETGASWAIAAGEQVLGQVGLRAIMLFEASADVSYWVVPAARRRGLAGAAVRALASWAFGELGLHRLGLKHSTANEASCRVAGAAGFAPEGTLRGYLRHADGWHDMHVHGRLSTDDPL